MSLAPLYEELKGLSNLRGRDITRSLIQRYSDQSYNKLLVVSAPASGKTRYANHTTGAKDLDDIMAEIFTSHKWDFTNIGDQINANKDLFFSDLRFKMGANLANVDVFLTSFHDQAPLLAYYFGLLVIVVYVSDEQYEQNLISRNLDDKQKTLFRTWRSEYPTFMHKIGNIVLSSFDELDQYRSSRTLKHFAIASDEILNRPESRAAGSSMRIPIMNFCSQIACTHMIGSEFETLANLMHDDNLNGPFIFTNVVAQIPTEEDALTPLDSTYIKKVIKLVPYGRNVTGPDIVIRNVDSPYKCFVGDAAPTLDLSTYDYVVLICDPKDTFEFSAAHMLFYGFSDKLDKIIGIQISKGIKITYQVDGLIYGPLTLVSIAERFIRVVPKNYFYTEPSKIQVGLFSLSNVLNPLPMVILKRLVSKKVSFIVNYPSAEMADYMGFKDGKNSMKQTIDGKTYRDWTVSNLQISPPEWSLMNANRLLMLVCRKEKWVYEFKSKGCFPDNSLNMWLYYTNFAPKTPIQNVLTNMTGYVKCVTMTIRQLIGLSSIDFHYFRRLAVVRQGGIPIYHHRITGYFLNDHKSLKLRSKDPVAVAGHMINMLLSTTMHAVDFADWLAVISDNARMNHHGRPSLPQKYYTDTEIDELGNGLRFHSYADYILAIDAYRNICLQFNISMRLDVIQLIIIELDNISAKYNTFNHQGYQSRDFSSSIDSLEAARMRLITSGLKN